MLKAAQVFLVSITVLIASGCSNVLMNEKDEVLFQKIEQLEEQIENEAWEQARAHIDALQTSHQQRLWKMQLLGGASENKDIQTELMKLKVSITEEEKLDALTGLTELKHRIYLLYNL